MRERSCSSRPSAGPHNPRDLQLSSGDDGGGGGGGGGERGRTGIPETGWIAHTHRLAARDSPALGG